MKTMKALRGLLTLLVCGCFVTSFTFADVGTETDNTALMKVIKDLQNEIKDLQQEVTTLRTQVKQPAVPKSLEDQIAGLQQELNTLKTRPVQQVAVPEVPSAAVQVPS